MKKRKGVRKIIEDDKRPDLEEYFFKFHGEEPESYCSEREDSSVIPGPKDYINRVGGLRKHAEIHTHPYNPKKEDWKTALAPSHDDLYSFFKNRDAKSMTICSRNKESGKVDGSITIRKKEKPLTVKNALLGLADFFTFGIPKNLYLASSLESLRYGEMTPENIKRTLDEAAKKYNFKYRIVPAKSYHTEKLKETDKNGGIEGKVLGFIGVGSILLGLLFLSQNITGNVILNNNHTISNWIGGILFIIGIIGIFNWFRKRR